MSSASNVQASAGWLYTNPPITHDHSVFRGVCNANKRNASFLQSLNAKSKPMAKGHHELCCADRSLYVQLRVNQKQLLLLRIVSRGPILLNERSQNLPALCSRRWYPTQCSILARAVGSEFEASWCRLLSTKSVVSCAISSCGCFCDVCQLMRVISGTSGDSQLPCSLDLLFVTWAAVEDPHQSLLVEAWDLVLQNLDVGHVVALWQLEVWNVWPWRCVVVQRIDLC